MLKAALLTISILCSVAVLRAEPVPSGAATGAFESEKVMVGGSAYAFRLLQPETVEAGHKYPCILFLHGSGERGEDNVRQLTHFCLAMSRPEMRRKYPCFVIAPQCREEQRWVERPWEDAVSSPMDPEAGLMLRYALAALDQVQASRPVDSARVYLTGLSMGGYGTWELGMRYPERFACMAPVCGGADDSRASALKSMPLWVWHGAEDRTVPVERSRSAVAAVKLAGNPTVRYTELPGVRHDSWTAAYAGESGLLDWMFQQRRRSPAGGD